MRSAGSDIDNIIIHAYSQGRVHDGYSQLAHHYRKPLVQVFARRLGYAGQMRGKAADDLAHETLERVHLRLSHGSVASLPAMLYLHARSIFQGAARRSPDALDHRMPMAEPTPVIERDGVEDDEPLTGAIRIRPRDAQQLSPHTGSSSVPKGIAPGTLPAVDSPLMLDVDVLCTAQTRPEALTRAQRLRLGFLDCLRALPNHRHREAFQLWLLGETYQEIARHLGWKGFEGAVSAVKSARKLLLECLRSKGEDIPAEL